MRYLIILLIFISGCKEGSTSLGLDSSCSDISGLWISQNETALITAEEYDDILHISSDCSASLDNYWVRNDSPALCSLGFEFQHDEDNSFFATITESNHLSLCGDIGVVLLCNITKNTDSLNIDCGSGDTTYIKGN